jgi:hypothetical protein
LITYVPLTLVTNSNERSADGVLVVKVGCWKDGDGLVDVAVDGREEIVGDV